MIKLSALEMPDTRTHVRLIDQTPIECISYTYRGGSTSALAHFDMYIGNGQNKKGAGNISKIMKLPAFAAFDSIVQYSRNKYVPVHNLPLCIPNNPRNILTRNPPIQS